MTDLKPCPFCGVVPDIGDRKSVQCTNKRCRLILAVTFSITDWNTRAEDAPDPDCPACEGHGVVATTKSDLDGNYIETSCPKCADIVEKPDDKEVREAVEVAKDLYPDSDSVETLIRAATAKCGCSVVRPIKGLTLGSAYEGKITEKEALDLVNAVINSQIAAHKQKDTK